MNITYVELFKSIQGEGHYTGRTSVFLRLAGCNLECKGFGQLNPSDPSTYVEQDIFKDPKSYKTLEDLPVMTVGCDSSYSVSSKFKHLFKTTSTEELAKLVNEATGISAGQFPLNEIHFVITGGEPMLWQPQIIELIKDLIDSGEYPTKITIETNGTKPISHELADFIRLIRMEYAIEWMWSISPKLQNVSGEVNAIFPDVWEEYFHASQNGYFKFVVNDSEAAWNELGHVLNQRERFSISKDCYIMPVGATKEQQEDSKVIERIARRAVKEGYYISGRLHCNLFGNTTNT